MTHIVNSLLYLQGHVQRLIQKQFSSEKAFYVSLLTSIAAGMSAR